MRRASSRPQPSAEPRGGEDEQLWAAVGEPSRRRVLDVLLALGEATPTTLAAELPFSRQAVAKHLAVLERAGLVEGRRQGREVRYVVASDRLAVAAEAMTRVATQWDQRLAAIKRIAEAVHRERSANDQ
jgi:DNA-binding transcriptional ArsR family regulator